MGGGGGLLGGSGGCVVMVDGYMVVLGDLVAVGGWSELVGGVGG